MTHIIEASVASAHPHQSVANIRPRKDLMRALRFLRPLHEYKNILSEGGVTAIEYAFIAMLIALAIIASVSLIAPALNPIFTKVSTAL